jgi:hypothetical protein
VLTEPAPALAVICAPQDAAILGRAAATELARARRAPCVAVAVWTGCEAPAPLVTTPASRAARGLAAVLVARGLDARAAGRVVAVVLAAAQGEAAAQAESVFAAAGGAPTVLVLGGPRGEPFDAVLALRPRVLVATRPDADPAVAPLAAAEAAGPGAVVAACPVAPGTLARALDRAGLGAPSIRAALRGPLEALA